MQLRLLYYTLLSGLLGIFPNPFIFNISHIIQLIIKTLRFSRDVSDKTAK